MGKYDFVDKRYFLKPERLAELLSVGLYHRRFGVEARDLKELSGDYQSLGGAFGILQRDGLFLNEKHGLKYGIELENYSDFSMPRRILTYDACEYEKQAKEIARTHEKYDSFEEKKSRMKEGDSYTPIVNVVVYLGSSHWRGGTALRDIFNLSEGVLPHNYDKIQNYTFALIEAEYVNPSDYETDLKLFFRAMQCRYDKERLQVLLQSEEYQELEWETECAIVVHLGIKNLIKKVVEEEESMCKAMRDWAKEERETGRQEGREEERISAIQELLKNGIPKEFILRLKYTEEEYAEAIS